MATANVKFGVAAQPVRDALNQLGCRPIDRTLIEAALVQRGIDNAQNVNAHFTSAYKETRQPLGIGLYGLPLADPIQTGAQVGAAIHFFGGYTAEPQGELIAEDDLSLSRIVNVQSNSSCILEVTSENLTLYGNAYIQGWYADDIATLQAGVANFANDGIRINAGTNLIATHNLTVAACDIALGGDAGSLIHVNGIYSAPLCATWLDILDSQATFSNIAIPETGDFEGIFKLAGASVFAVESGKGFRAGLIHIEQGTTDENNPVTVFLEGIKFLAETDLTQIRSLFTAESRGHVNLRFASCFAEAGTFYAAFEGLINLTSDSAFELISGGYLNVAVSVGNTYCNVTTLPGIVRDNTAVDNAPIINAYYTDGTYKSKGNALYFPAGMYSIKSTIVLPSIEGLVLLGDGASGSVRPEIEYTSAMGGRISRIVNTQAALPVMLQSYAGAPYIQGLGFCGWWHANNRATLLADIANHALVGIQIMPRYTRHTSGIGVGKLTSPLLGINCCGDAILCGDPNPTDPLDVESTQDNADQLNIGKLFACGCGRGLHCWNTQSVGHHIEQFTAYDLRGEMFYFERGGKLNCGQATPISPTQTVLRTRAQNGDVCSFQFNSIYYDSNCYQDDANYAKIFVSDLPLSGESGAPTDLVIDYLHMTFSGAAADKLKSIFKMRTYNKITINGGIQLQPAMFQVNGDSSAGFRSAIEIDNARWRSSVTDLRTQLLNTGVSEGYVDVRVTKARNIGNARIAPVDYQWLNGEITDY